MGWLLWMGYYKNKVIKLKETGLENNNVDQ